MQWGTSTHAPDNNCEKQYTYGELITFRESLPLDRERLLAVGEHCWPSLAASKAHPWLWELPSFSTNWRSNSNTGTSLGTFLLSRMYCPYWSTWERYWSSIMLLPTCLMDWSSGGLILQMHTSCTYAPSLASQASGEIRGEYYNWIAKNKRGIQQLASYVNKEMYPPYWKSCSFYASGTIWESPIKQLSGSPLTVISISVDPNRLVYTFPGCTQPACFWAVHLGNTRGFPWPCLMLAANSRLNHLGSQCFSFTIVPCSEQFLPEDQWQVKF